MLIKKDEFIPTVSCKKHSGKKKIQTIFLASLKYNKHITFNLQ